MSCNKDVWDVWCSERLKLLRWVVMLVFFAFFALRAFKHYNRTFLLSLISISIVASITFFLEVFSGLLQSSIDFRLTRSIDSSLLSLGFDKDGFVLVLSSSIVGNDCSIASNNLFTWLPFKLRTRRLRRKVSQGLSFMPAKCCRYL